MSSSTSSSDSGAAQWRRSSLWFGIAATALTATLSLGLGELTVRALGRATFEYSRAVSTSPRMVDPDPVLGWKNRPGIYRYSAVADGTHPIEVSIRADGARRVDGASPPYYFLGGSLTFGYGVSDGETFADRIAAETKRASINLASPGYGPVQALRSFRRAMREREKEAAPGAVIYGLIDHHKNRASLDASWIRNWDLLPPPFRDVTLPFARLGSNGEWIEYEPTRHAPWPLRQHSALVTLLEERWIDLYWGISESEMDRTLVASLVEIARATDAVGVPLLVVALMMDDDEVAQYGVALRERDIPFEDCRHAHYRRTERSDEFIVPNDGHPNAVVHQYFAACILGSRRLAPHLGLAREEVDLDG